MSMIISVNAIQNAIDRVNCYAANVSAGVANENLAKDMVGMMVAEKEVKLAVKVVQTQDSMLGSILDIKA